MKSIWNSDLRNGRYRNPILYTDYSDPDVCRVGKDYFMTASTFCNVPGLVLLHSVDLVNWKVVNYILDRLPGDRYDRPMHGCGVWAPAIRYHEGLFFVCFPMVDEGIFMTTAEDPFGKWSEPVNIRPGAGWIDPCPFWDDDGRAYLVSAVARSRIGYNGILYITEMSYDGMSLIGTETRVFDGNENGQRTIEGPKLYKRNGFYYIFAPAGGVKMGWQTVLRSENIYGPYEYKVVLQQGKTAINGPHQGAWVDTVTGEDWFVHFQDVYGAGRIVHLQPLRWENDWPVMGDNGEPVKEYSKPNVGCEGKQPICEPAVSDEFNGDSLGLQWQWNANYSHDWYSLTGHSLKLCAVKDSEAEIYANLPNLLLQKWPAPEFSCVFTMNTEHLQIGDEAGVISMGMRYAALVLTSTKQGLKAEYVWGTQFFGKIEESKTIQERRNLDMLILPESRIYVKYVVKRNGTVDLSDHEKGFPAERISLGYSIDGIHYIKAGEIDAVPGRWTGVKFGTFCSRKAEGKGGYLELESVICNRDFSM